MTDLPRFTQRGVPLFGSTGLPAICDKDSACCGGANCAFKITPLLQTGQTVDPSGGYPTILSDVPTSCSFRVDSLTVAPPGTTITGYKWVFSDGGIGAGKTTTHTYNRAISLTQPPIKLTVYLSDGNKLECSGFIGCIGLGACSLCYPQSLMPMVITIGISGFSPYKEPCSWGDPCLGVTARANGAWAVGDIGTRDRSEYRNGYYPFYSPLEFCQNPDRYTGDNVGCSWHAFYDLGICRPVEWHFCGLPISSLNLFAQIEGTDTRIVSGHVQNRYGIYAEAAAGVAHDTDYQVCYDYYSAARYRGDLGWFETLYDLSYPTATNCRGGHTVYREGLGTPGDFSDWPDTLSVSI